MTPSPTDDFKTRTLALIARLHLSNEDVVALGIGMAVSHAVVGMIGPATLHQAVDDTLASILRAVDDGEVRDVRH